VAEEDSADEVVEVDSEADIVEGDSRHIRNLQFEK
jgi:hypothetical protein